MPLTSKQILYFREKETAIFELCS